MALRELAAACLLAGTLLGIPGALTAGEPQAESQSLTTMMRLAVQAEADGHAATAAALYRQAHEAHPFAADPLAAWGLLANRLGEAETAIELFQAALAAEGGHRAARRGLGAALLSLDRGEEALTVYERLLTEDASDVDAWNGKGLALDHLGDYQAAQRAYRTGLAAAPVAESGSGPKLTYVATATAGDVLPDQPASAARGP